MESSKSQVEQLGCPITYQVKRKHTPEGKLLNDYLIVKKIGEGPHARIKLAKNVRTQELVAIKKFALYLLKKKTRPKKEPDGSVKHISVVDDVFREMKIAASVNHHNVVKLHEIIHDREQEKLYLIMQYCQNGQISSWNPKLQRFETRPQYLQTERARELCLEMVKGLQYCTKLYQMIHSQSIMHRDIKPQNILINKQGRAQYIDFGRAVKLQKSEQRLKGSEGTYHFMAPQMLQQIDKSGYDGRTCDVWSLGVTLYCVFIKKLPFDGQPILKLFQSIQQGQFTYPKECSIPPFIKKAIDGMIVAKVSQRLKLQEVQKILLE